MDRNPIQPILGLSELLRTKEIENIKNSGEINIQKIETILDIIIRISLGIPKDLCNLRKIYWMLQELKGDL
jgi:hypothetical protein